MNKLLENENIQVGNLIQFAGEIIFLFRTPARSWRREPRWRTCSGRGWRRWIQLAEINIILLFSRFDSEMTEDEENEKKIVDVR